MEKNPVQECGHREAMLHLDKKQVLRGELALGHFFIKWQPDKVIHERDVQEIFPHPDKNQQGRQKGGQPAKRENTGTF